MERSGKTERDGMKYKVWRDKSRGETGSLREKWRKQVRRRRRKMAKERDEEQKGPVVTTTS